MEAAAPLVMVSAKSPADGSAEQAPTMEMLREMETYIHKRISYVNKEVDWAKMVLKLRKLHHGLNKLRQQAAEDAEARGKAGARSLQDSRYSASRSDSAGRGGREQRGDYERTGGGGPSAP